MNLYSDTSPGPSDAVKAFFIAQSLDSKVVQAADKLS